MVSASLMKKISLVVLVMQNTAMVLIMRYSLTTTQENGERYITSTAVFMSEFIKFILCICAVAVLARPSESLVARQDSSLKTVLRASFDGASFKVAVPAILYTVQNNLQYLAMAHLDAVTFQVTYQLKILTTAIFAVTILRRHISWDKWAALLALTLGVALCQVPQDTSLSTMSSLCMPDWKQCKGLLAVLAACITSGLAGTYVELLLKCPSKDSNATTTSASTTPAPLKMWTTNLQLSFFSLVPAFCGVIFSDGSKIMDKGFFVGYTASVWATIVCQALGGLIVAFCVTYADNIIKIFATSLSLLLSAAVSVVYFNFTVTSNFRNGALLVLAASWLYNRPQPAQSQSPKIGSHDMEKGNLFGQLTSERV